MRAIAPRNVAVVTGAASGIGLAAARYLAAAGMRVCMVDGGERVIETAKSLSGDATGFAIDMSDRLEIARLARNIQAVFGPVSVLMNNAGVRDHADALGKPEIWEHVLSINLMGMLYAIQAFVPAMIAHDEPAMVINTGAKEGVTQSPGNTAYNVSEAAVKALTEGLAHSLREATGERVTAHLLLPGAWAAEQIIDFMMPRLSAGDFYILCPDHDVTRDMELKGFAWAAGDLIDNRPALSRWHPDYKMLYAEYVEAGSLAFYRLAARL